MNDSKETENLILMISQIFTLEYTVSLYKVVFRTYVCQNLNDLKAESKLNELFVVRSM